MFLKSKQNNRLLTKVRSAGRKISGIINGKVRNGIPLQNSASKFSVNTRPTVIIWETENSVLTDFSVSPNSWFLSQESFYDTDSTLLEQSSTNHDRPIGDRVTNEIATDFYQILLKFSRFRDYIDVSLEYIKKYKLIDGMAKSIIWCSKWVKTIILPLKRHVTWP